MPARGFALLLMAMTLAACGGLGGEPEILATMPPTESVQRATLAEPDWKPDIENGAGIFAERCVECHGVAGDGRGELALAGSIEPPLDMTERAQVAQKSPLAWFEIISKGNIANLMPPWENALSEEERWDLALYSYTLAYDEELLALGGRIWREQCGDCALPPLIPPVFSDVEYGAKLNRERFGDALTDAEAGAAVAYARMASLAPRDGPNALPAIDDVGQIRGALVQGTAGSVLPADILVQLRYGNADLGFRVAEAITDGDGEFRFDDIPISPDYDYAVGAMYKGRLFSQRISAADLSAANHETTITVFDETNDPLAISVARINMSIEPVTLEDRGAGLYISQMLTYRNETDRVYTSGRGFDDGREAALLVQFPGGARFLSGDAGGRYIVIEGMEGLPDSVIDTLPVLPGEVHQVFLAYWLPLADGAQFEQSFNNLIDAEVIVTLPDEFRIESDWLRQSADAGVGAGYKQYLAELTMDIDAQLRFGISSDPFATSSDDDWVVTSESLPALLFGALALVGTLLGAVAILTRRKSGEIDALASELARLEEDHDHGRINHDLYHHRRRELKAKLARLMEASDE
ncbi:MAG: cytochrome c [Chloroflexi bacterium]|nr:cytochrome c [Chloroflexota bacterium]